MLQKIAIFGLLSSLINASLKANLLSSPFFLKTATKTKPDMNIHNIGSENLGKAWSAVRIPVTMKIIVANKPVSLKGTHSVIHRIIIQSIVPNAIGGRSKMSERILALREGNKKTS